MAHPIEWTDERPTKPGEYWLSLPPDRRQQYGHKQSVLSVAVKVAKSGLAAGLIGTTGYWPLSDSQFDGALWSVRETPADPFEEVTG